MADLPNFNTFSGNTLDRAGNIRKNSEWLSSKINHPKAKFLPMLNLLAPIQTFKNSFTIKYLNFTEISIFNDR